jgi:hypothetical protein
MLASTVQLGGDPHISHGQNELSAYVLYPVSRAINIKVTEIYIGKGQQIIFISVNADTCSILE